MKTFKQFLEAVGDPLSSRNVIPLNKETQKNIRSTMTPSGPPPMSQTSSAKSNPKAKSDPATKFVKRMVGSTHNSPL
jgi:hypothetical protein